MEAHLVLAIAITSCWTPGHLIAVYKKQALLANEDGSCKVQS